MNYYEKNMERMKANQTRLYEEYLKKKDDTRELNVVKTIQSSDAKDGERFLTVCSKFGDYRLNSTYHPVEEAKKWAEQFELQNLNTVVAMFGLGNGMLTRALIMRMAETDHLLLYEPSFEIFEHVLHNYDISDILSRENTTLIVEEINGSDLHFTMYSMIDISNIKSQLQCIHPCYDRIFTESCLRYYKEIGNCFHSARVSINTGIHLGKKFIENSLANIHYLSDSKSLLGLKDILPNELPAIVVAAGPSVQDNIEDLKKAKGKAVIFAVDRILDYLLDSNVIPDFVVSVDPMKKMEHFTLRKDIKIPLICYLESNPNILLKHSGEKILCSNSTFMEELYQRMGEALPRLGTSGSVAIVAYRACVELGFKRVILVGQDLAYRDGFSHVGGVNEEKGKDEYTYVEGLTGEPIRSRHDWKTFISQYQDLITLNPEVEVIDAKQQGARIKGAVVMSLQEALKNYTLEGEEWRYLSSEHNDYIPTVIIREFLEDKLLDLKEIRAKAKQAIRECDRIMNLTKQENKQRSLDKSYQKLKEYNEMIQSKSIYALLDCYISAITAQQLAEVGLYTEDNNANNDKTINTSKMVYQAVIGSVDFTRLHVKKSIRRLVSL